MKKLKTVFKWLAIVGGILLSAALLVLTYFNWRAGVCLEEELRPLREAHEPMSIVDLTPAPVSPERNAATYLRRAEKGAQAINQELRPLSDKHDDYYEDDRLNDRGVKLVDAALAAYPDVVSLIEQAADASDYVPDHDYTQMPRSFLEPYLQKVQQSRALARVMQYRAEVLLAQHNRDEALKTGLTLVRLSGHFQREPMLVAYLVSVAVQHIGVDQIAGALDDGPVPSELHDQLEAELTRQLPSQAFIQTLRSERAYGMDSFRDFHGIGPPLIGFKPDECDFLKRMAAELKIGVAPRYKVEVELATMKADSQGARPLTRLLAPALEAAREAQQRSHARLQCLAVLNALTRRDQSPDSTIPSIDELRLPDEIATDPYNGQPLKISRTRSGWVVYSVGPNQKDDGGKIEKSEDVGVGPNG